MIKPDYYNVAISYSVYNVLEVFPFFADDPNAVPSPAMV